MEAKEITEIRWKPQEGEEIVIKLDEMKHGDALEILPYFPDNSIDLILTDPPYFISRDVIIRRSRNPKKYKFVGKDISLNFGNWDTQWEDKEAYIKWCYQWLAECFRILKQGGHLVFFVDKIKVSYFTDFAEANGMLTRQPLFWIKTNPVPQARKVSFMEGVEMCLWFTKETTSRKFATFNYQLGQHANYFEHCIVGHTTKKDGERFHPTQKPVAFCEWIISYLSNEGDIVLDPFAGSGTTCIAAARLNRRFFGIEINKRFWKKAAERVEWELQQAKLFFSRKESKKSAEASLWRLDNDEK